MKKINLKSPAKINLTLEITGKLVSGFHTLRSVMIKTENLYDELEIVFDTNKEGIRISCTDKTIPIDEKNICYKIAERFFEKSGKKVGLEIKIKKRIPAGAGLGGGSSNGASVLLALNKYFGNPLNQEQLIKIAAETGKDIPFFIQKERVAIVSGMGEKLQSIKKFPKIIFLIVNPRGEISTPVAYKQLDEKLWFMSDRKRKNITASAAKAKRLEDLSGILYNDFDMVAREKFPEIEILIKYLLSFGASDTSITGKGPTVFGIFDNIGTALKIKKLLKIKYPEFLIEIG